MVFFILFVVEKYLVEEESMYGKVVVLLFDERAQYLVLFHVPFFKALTIHVFLIIS